MLKFDDHDDDDFIKTLYYDYNEKTGDIGWGGGPVMVHKKIGALRCKNGQLSSDIQHQSTLKVISDRKRMKAEGGEGTGDRWHEVQRYVLVSERLTYHGIQRFELVSERVTCHEKQRFVLILK